MTKHEVREHVMAALEPAGARSRAMFGGYGLYFGDKFFGLVSSEGRVYFRTDDLSRAAYLERGMGPFQPQHRPAGPRTMARNFEVPADVLADAESLVEWALRAARS